MIERLKHYRLRRVLGRGAMGEVYLAVDTLLDREVALKVLPREFASNETRRARFTREAKAAAAVSHPGIVTLHSIEEAEDESGETVHFLTMELVDGLPLGASIPDTGMAITDLLELGTQLADAVAAAHARGILHRDLKPDNIMVTEDRRVKILDFGLALPIETRPGARESDTEAPTAAAQLTAAGGVIGTPAYMSPDQAEGLEVDHRSDIFSLGVLLYEMASGERPFQGRSASSVISAILRDEPKPLAEVRPALPEEFGKITRRCLQKQLDRRYQSALDIRNDLDELRQELASGTTSAQRAPGSTGRQQRLPWFLAAAGLATAVAAVAFFSSGRTEPVEPPSIPVSSIATEHRRVTDLPGRELFPNLSSDGKTLIFAHKSDDNWGIYRQRIGGRKVMNLTADHDGEDTMPALSPDDELIAFRSERDGGGIFLMGATGESVRRVSEVGYNPSWAPDGHQLVFSTVPTTTLGEYPPDAALWTVDIEYGETRRIEGAAGGLPAWSPNGHRIAYVTIRANRQRDIVTIAAAGGEPVTVTDDEADSFSPTWSPDGRFLYYRAKSAGNRGFYRVAIDEETGLVSGEPRAVTQTTAEWNFHLSIANDLGAYASLSQRSAIEVTSLHPSATESAPQPIVTDTEPLGIYDISRDGRNILFITGMNPQRRLISMRSDGTGRRELVTGTLSLPRWSPDGTRIALAWKRTDRYQLYTISPDGSELKQLTAHPEGNSAFPVWSGDGLRLAYWQESTDSIHIIDPSSDTPARTLAGAVPGTEGLQPSDWSGDERRLLAGRDIGTIGGVFLLDLETGTSRRLTETGKTARWLRDGRVGYVDHEHLLALDPDTGETTSLVSRPDIRIFDYFAPDPLSDNIYYNRRNVQSDIWTVRLAGVAPLR